MEIKLLDWSLSQLEKDMPNQHDPVLGAKIANLEAENAELRAALADMIGDFPRGVKSNALEAARALLEEKP